jgi:hypothetical protein
MLNKANLCLNLGCLHPVAHVISYDVGFNLSTQRHYRRLIYYLCIHSYMFRSYDHHQAEKYMTTLGLLNWQRIRCLIRSHITVIVYIMLHIIDTPLLWATFFLRCVPSVYRYSTGVSLLMRPYHWLIYNTFQTCWCKYKALNLCFRDISGVFVL